MRKMKIGGLMAISALSFMGAAHAQDTNALDGPAGAPVQIAPLDVELDNDANPTFEWSVRSNATEYRLYVLAIEPDGSREAKRYRFTSTGSSVTQNGTNVEVCANATTGNCAFTPTDLDLGDGTRAIWVIGARNSFNDGRKFANSPGGRFQNFQFMAPAATLDTGDYYGPRGNLSDDAGTIRSQGSGPITFEFANNGDASSFQLVLETAPEGNAVPVQTYDLDSADCTTDSGLLDTCTVEFDPVDAINNSANDFCWRVVATNGRSGSAASDPDEKACFAMTP